MGCGTCSKVIDGVTGIAKAIAHVDRAEPGIIAQRRAKCRTCPYAIPCPVLKRRVCRCGKCDCLLKCKTVIKSEKCPEGFW